MSYDEALAERVRAAFPASAAGISEKKMFGGIAFLRDGNMFCGIVGAELMVRVGREGQEEALRAPGARPMDFTGRPMAGYVFVGADGLRTARELTIWVGRGLAHAASLPPKSAKSPKPARAVKAAGRRAQR